MNNDEFSNENNEEEKNISDENHNYDEHSDELSSTETYEDVQIPDEIPDEIYLEKTPIKNKYTSGTRGGRKSRNKTRHRGFRGSAFSYILLTLVVAILGGAIGAYFGPVILGTVDGGSGGITLPGEKQEITIRPTDGVETATAVAKKAMSSVVGITTLETREFWFQERDVEGVGSGVIVESNGYILTNSHVVADGRAKEVNVLLDSGETLPAEVLWNDSLFDLAVIKINAKNLPVAELGNSDELEVGETAIAIGNPLGLEFQRTVTSGVISGLNRSIQMDNNTIIDNLIQTDASINPGNSGGPLLNREGKVIGINTAKISSGEGLGFSIPINTAIPIINEVVETGTYKTVALGISGMTAQEFKARVGNVEMPDEGVVILEVEQGSSADIAGLEVGDIITKLEASEIDTMQTLRKLLYEYSFGDEVELTVIRNNEEIKVPLKFL